MYPLYGHDVRTALLGLGWLGICLLLVDRKRTGRWDFGRSLIAVAGLGGWLLPARDFQELWHWLWGLGLLWTLGWRLGLPAALALLVVAALVVPNFIHPHCGGQLTSCKSNLKNMATAMEMYADNHGGELPRHLADLTPHYLKIIPNCPSTQRDDYAYSRRGQSYTLACFGEHQRYGVPLSYPRYSSQEGLIER